LCWIQSVVDMDVEPFLRQSDSLQSGQIDELKPLDCEERKEQVIYGVPPVVVQHRGRGLKHHWCLMLPCIKHGDGERATFWDESLQDVAEKWKCQLRKQFKDDELHVALVKSCFTDWAEFPGPEEVDRLATIGTFHAFSSEMRRVLVRRLQSNCCGLQLHAESSVDHDEVFLSIICPSLPDFKPETLVNSPSGSWSDAPTYAAEMLAARLGVLCKAHRDGYQTCSAIVNDRRKVDPGLEIPTDHDGIEYPNWAPFSKDANETYRQWQIEREGKLDHKAEGLFANFAEIQLIRMVKYVLDETVDLTRWKEINLINDFFLLHDFGEMQKVEVALPSIIPSCLGGCGFKPVPLRGVKDHNIELVRLYLGEETAFFYDFLCQYCQALWRPVIYACIFWAMINIDKESIVLYRIVFSLCIAGWASHLCDDMAGREETLIVRWGQHENSGACARVEGFDEEADETEGDFKEFSKWRHVLGWKIVSTILTITAMTWIIATAAVLNWIRLRIHEHPDQYTGLTWMYEPWTCWRSSHVERISETRVQGPGITAILISLNNRVTGMLWDATARWIVKKENHKNVSNLNDSLAIKLYLVYLFNWTYPFLYLAFVKKFTEGCADSQGNLIISFYGNESRVFKNNNSITSDKGNCQLELETSLVNFFALSAIIDALIVFVNWLKARIKIGNELKAAHAGEEYTYVEVQGKLGEPNLVLDDMTEFMVNFTFVCCFTYACPAVCVLALGFNCFLATLYLWQRLRLQRRGQPIRTRGLPIWNQLMRYSMLASCTINAAMAAFAVPPYSYEREAKKLEFFIKMEHAMFVMVMIFMVAVPDLPKQTQRMTEYNDDNEHLLMDPNKKHQATLPHGVALRLQLNEDDIMPQVFSHHPEHHLP